MPSKYATTSNACCDENIHYDVTCADVRHSERVSVISGCPVLNWVFIAKYISMNRSNMFIFNNSTSQHFTIIIANIFDCSKRR